MTTSKSAVPLLLKSLLRFQFNATARIGRVGPSDVGFANQRRPHRCLPAGDAGFGDMREGQKEKGHKGRATHSLHLAMVALHVRMMMRGTIALPFCQLLSR